MDTQRTIFKPVTPDEPGPPLYNTVRALFMARGETLAGHCRRLGVQRQNARAALLGAWRGPRAEELVHKICAEAWPDE